MRKVLLSQCHKLGEQILSKSYKYWKKLHNRHSYCKIVPRNNGARFSINKCLTFKIASLGIDDVFCDVHKAIRNKIPNILTCVFASRKQVQNTVWQKPMRRKNATLISGLCHGIFTEWFTFSIAFLL